MKHAQVMIGTVAVLLLAVGVATAPAQPQLSGTWVLDRAQSQLPSHEGQNKPSPDAQAPPPEVKLRVEQQGNAVKVTRTMTMGTRERSMTDTYVADGSDQTHRGYRGGNVVTRAAFEGDRLVVTVMQTRKSDQGERTMSQHSTWSVSPDGRLLTIDTTMQTPSGDRAMKTLYVRS